VKTVELARSRNILAMVWCAGAFLLIAVLAIQTLADKYDDAKTAWSWLLPTVMPTLGVVISGSAAEALLPERSSQQVSRFFFSLALAVSAFYLLMVIAVLASASAADKAASALRDSDIFLGPLQGVVGVSLGVFFTMSHVQPAPSAEHHDSQK
jgi:hypothetical protein